MTNRVSAKNKKFYEELLESYCDVCFTHFRKVPAKKINEGLEILVCTKCHCKTHKCCYDLAPNETVISDRIRQFICDKCIQSKQGNKQCFVCHQTDGALIFTEQKQLIHVFCALYHNQIDILSYSPKIKVQKSVSYSNSLKSCDICKKPNAFESCAFENCKKNSHPYCVKKIYIKEQMQSQQPKCWNHHLACAASNVFDLSDQIIPFPLLKDTIQDQLKQVEENAPFQIPNKQSTMKKIYDQYLKQAIQQKKTSTKMKRGGYSFISCPEHQYTPYCICQGVGEGGAMIQCETCLTWFHMDCIKYKPNPTDQIEEPFSCMFCKSFYQLKRKIIDEVIVGKNQNFQLKCQLSPKMTFMDIMWILRSIDSRIAKGNVSKMVKQLMKYPLRSSKMEKLIKIQNKNTLQVLSEEFFHQFFFSDEQSKFFKPHAVLGIDSENKPVKLDENIEKNRELRKFITILRSFCKKQGIVNEFKAIQTELDFKEEAISDSYEKIIELSKSQQKYQEVAILKIKAQAYSFLQIVKKVNSGSIITINQLQQSVRKANLIQNVPEYLTQPLTEKYERVKSILNNLKQLIQKDPYNLIEIKQTANRLTIDFKIQPPLFYEYYLEQRNFINTLHFYHVKQTEGKIQAELSLKEKLQQLIIVTQSDTFICNDELSKNLNNFLQLRLKTSNPTYYFIELKKIVQNLQKKTIKTTLSNLQTINVFKKQKLQYLFEKSIQYKIQDPFVTNLIQKYQQISSAMKEITEKSLENVSSVNSLRILSDNCANLMESLQKYPLKIQQEIKNNKSITWLQMARFRKQQIDQLLTLAQEAQLQKNPLSINKLIESIPKQNPLVKTFRQLKKQHQEMHNQFVSLMAFCSQKMQYFKSEGLKKTRKEQIQINEKKPDVKRFNQLLQTLNLSKVDFSKQIKDITKIINKSLDTSYSVEKFYKAKQNFEKVNSQDELANARKQIDELRKKVLIHNQIALTNELTHLYHSEIHNRMRSNLVAGNYDLDKNNKLLKFAEEEGIANTSTYFKLKEKLDSKNQKSKEINIVKNIETRLKTQASKETDPMFKNIYAARKLLHIPDVEQQTPKIPYIQELKQKNKQLKTKITKILNLGPNIQSKASLDQAKVLLLQALKTPFNLSNLSQFYLEVQRAHSFYTSWKRSNSLGRNTLYNDQKLKEYEKLKFRIEELQTTTKQIYKLKSSLRILQTIQNIQTGIQGTLTQNLYQNLSLIQENIQTIEENQLAGGDNQMLLLAKRKYLKIWFSYLMILRRVNSSIKQQEDDKKQEEKCQILVNVNKIKKLLYDCYFLLQNQLKSSIGILNSDQIINELKEIIIELQNLFIQIKFNYLEGNYNKNTNIMDQWIDLEDFFYQLKVGTTLDDIFFVYKPFDDLNKFKYRNLTAKNTDLLLASRNSNKEETIKRPRPEQFNAQIKEERPFIKKSSSQFVKNQQSSDSEQKRNPTIVTLNSRKKIKQILSKNVSKNIQLKKVGTWQNQVKMIENQIFGQYHDNVVKYFETSQKFEKLFIKLQQCPQISKKLIKKQFEFKFIKLLVENLSTIDDIQALMVNKLKEQKNNQKFNATLQTASFKTNSINQTQEKQKTNVLDMLATGVVNEEYKKSLANQMKKIKEGKDKKKKKSKHRHRSRSRSASPEAKFSSQSEPQNIPSYIQKEYAQENSKNPFQNRVDMDIIPAFPRNDQPLMFDPDIKQEQIEDMEKKYPRGSTLKIKTATLQFFLKKKGKMEMKIGLYTQQDYKKLISEVVDPGFLSLNIRKQKSDKQILDYLNKPSRKKYKFITCWIEGENVKANENLKQLSQQANDRHKIYGWQNDQIKIHVMSIKQFVQLTKFSSSTPNKTVFKECVQMFDTERMICVIQYPAEKMYELKQKFKNFTNVQRIEETYDVNIPLPSYDAYEPIQSQNPYYPAMGDIQNSNIPSIKPLAFNDAMIKQSKPVEFEGWGSSSGFQTDALSVKTGDNPYEQTRLNLGFGRFSPIMSDEQDNLPLTKQPLPDLADSLLKSFEQKDKFQIPSIDTTYRNQRNFTSQPFEHAPYGGMKYNRPQYGQQKFYDGVGGGNPVNQGMNPMRGYNNSMGYQNRGYSSQTNQGYNPMNRYQNQGGEYRQHNYQNQYNQNRNLMPYNQRQNRNPMFNPMSNPVNSTMNNPINPGQNAMNSGQNPMNSAQNQMNYGQQNQYPPLPNNPRYPYQDRGNNSGGYQQQ